MWVSVQALLSSGSTAELRHRDCQLWGLDIWQTVQGLMPDVNFQGGQEGWDSTDRREGERDR